MYERRRDRQVGELGCAQLELAHGRGIVDHGGELVDENAQTAVLALSASSSCSRRDQVVCTRASVRNASSHPRSASRHEGTAP
jgi:hypothetical protein